MSVCRMVKTKKRDSYRRDGDTYRVSGFALSDSYGAVIRKAAAPLLEKEVNYDMCSLIVSQARVVNLPLESGAWTLGVFLKGLGGLVMAKRLILGVYMPENCVSYKTFMQLMGSELVRFSTSYRSQPAVRRQVLNYLVSHVYYILMAKEGISQYA